MPRSLPLWPILVLLLLAGTAAARQVPSLDGSYTLLPAASDDIHQAIERGIAGMSFVLRPVARSRLRRTNDPYRSVAISRTPTQVTITIDGRPPILTPADGSPIRWQREDGEWLQVSTLLRDGVLRQSFVAEDGQRENAYSLSANGDTLSMRVTVSSPRLPRPVAYRLVFLRASGR